CHYAEFRYRRRFCHQTILLCRFNTTQGASFRDHFIEIYNNSNEVLYADGLYIATLEGNTNSTLTSYTLPTGQYDWSQSTGNNIGSAANTDYVYASNIIKVPGTGTQY